MAAADLDIGYVAGHLGLSEDGLTTLAADPNVLSLLQAVAIKAHEFNELDATKLRVEIELENALVGTENRVQAFKETADKALKDLEELRQKLAAEGTSQF
jgi:nucleoprotein TPR